MSKVKKDNPSRRKFLSLGILGGVSLVAGQASAETPPVSDGEKVKMLTPDGQLVEVDKSVLEKSTNRQKASNKDILSWANPKEKILQMLKHLPILL